MRKITVLCIVWLWGLSCENSNNPGLKEGIWVAELEVQDSEVLPFNFDLKKNSDGQYTMEIYNAEEVIEINELAIINDSIIIKTPVFEGYIAAKFTDSTIQGEFIKESLDHIVPFNAKFGQRDRFIAKQKPQVNISGIWRTEFSPDTEDSYLGKGIFTQNGNKVTGTFRTTTGDYRFLEGVLDGDIMKISTFDGAHAFLFTAKVNDSSLVGTFYSGNHFQEPFIAERNESFELPEADSLTYLKPGYSNLAFSFPDVNGAMVSLDDTRYKNRAVIVQIMGTWCPNCLDETKFLVNYLKNNPEIDVEVVALAFEYAKTQEKAFNGIKRLTSAIGVDYPILLAQFGTSNKSKAQEKLPMLNHVISYPTTIFIDKKGAVRKIHTGFNGPATGSEYEVFKDEFDDFVKLLVSE